MSIPFTEHLWHKGSEKQPWMRKFVIVKDSVLRIYGTRNDHSRNKEPLVALELISNTEFKLGSDNVVHIGWMQKKGMVYWNPRWCILTKRGYISYVDPEAKHEVRDIDLMGADIKATLEPNMQINIKATKAAGGTLYQFRLEDKAAFGLWHKHILDVQKDCARIRKSASGSNQPTLFPFMLMKPNDSKGSNSGVCHYFCCDSEESLLNWQQALASHIGLGGVASAGGASGPQRTPNISINTSPGGPGTGPNRNSALNTPKSRSMKSGGIVGNAVSATVNALSNKKQSVVGTLSSRMSVGTGNEAAAGKKNYYTMPEAELNKAFESMVDELRLPPKAASMMLKMPKPQKIQMLEAHQVKKKSKSNESGKTWALKFAGNRSVRMQDLQTFSVVLRDENERFVKEFISELGLNHLCRLGQTKRDMSFDKELLTVFKAIIDTERTVTSLINHDLVVRLIVQKIDSKDARVRELALQLLVSFVAIDTDMTERAVTDIMSSLQDQASLHGTRNRWKPLIAHMSTKDLYYGTILYDQLCVTLVNFLLSSMASVEERTEERRLLHGEQFDKILNKLEDKMHRQSMRGSRNEMAALQTQIETYFAMRKEDAREANLGDIDNDGDDLDLSDPKELFDRLQKQALEDGYINELTRILSNLVTLPASAGSVWYNVSRIVGEACQPIQSKMLQNAGYGRAVTSALPRHGGTATSPETAGTVGNLNATLKPGTQLGARVGSKSILFNQDEEYSSSSTGVQGQAGAENVGFSASKSGVVSHFPNYQALKHLLKVKETEDEKEPSRQLGKQLKQELDEQREKNLKLEQDLEKLQREFDELKANPSVVTHNIVGQGGGVSSGPSQGNAAASLQAALLAKKAPTEAAASSGPAVDDGYNKYRKMLKIGQPAASVANRMRQDGIDSSIIEAFEESGTLPNGNKLASSGVSNGPSQSGAAAALAAKLAGKSGGDAGAKKGAATGKLTDAEEKQVAKYRKMLKINMPKQSVINRMRQDGIDKAIIDKMFGSGSANSGLQGTGGAAKAKKKEEPKLPPNLKPKKVITPGVKMRNLHWNPINPFDVEKTIWKDITDDNIKLDTKGLESRFCWKEFDRKTPDADKAAKAGRSKKKDIVTVLDTKRAYNVEIFLGRVKMDNWEIRKAMLAMDELKLNREKIDKFINFVPTPTEAASLEGYEDEPNLGKAETFFKILKSVDPNLKQRLELWSFKVQFGELLRNENEKIEALKHAADALRNSKHFKEVLSIILAIGNYMNGGTSKGQQYGFKIASLTQLHRSRSVDNQQTLLEYLYLFLGDKYKNTLNFVSDLKAVEYACRVDIAAMRMSMSQIGGKLSLINKRLANPTKKMDDKFAEVMTPFYNSGIKQYEKVKASQMSTTKTLADVGLWLNEPRDVNCEYLKSINQFRKDFIMTEKLVAAKREKARKDAERAKRMAAKKKKGGQGGAAAASDVKPTQLAPAAGDKVENLSDKVMQGIQQATDSHQFMALLNQRRNKLVAGAPAQAE